MKKMVSIVFLAVCFLANLSSLDFLMMDGSKVSGEIQDKVEFITQFGTLSIDGSAIQSVSVEEKTSITLTDGQSFTGAIQNATLKVKWMYGVMDLDVKKLKSAKAETAAGIGGITANNAAVPVLAGMTRVEGGTFKMGSLNGEADERPVHDVTVSTFYMNTFEITQKEWVEIAGKNPSAKQGDNLPVERISFFEIIEYCNKKSIKEGLNPVYFYGTRGTDPAAWPSDWNIGIHNRISCDWGADGYRLPTEAEWEYAARGGKASKGYKYSGSDDIGFIAWYPGNAGSMTHSGGQREPNELGFYDMSGNVQEWCWDWFGLYSVESQTNPKGAFTGTLRTYRGGSWGYNESFSRSTNRDGIAPSTRSDNIGIRLVRANVK